MIPDASELARWQVRSDQNRTTRFPELLPRKTARMRASSLGFLRGSAPLFYEVLKRAPSLAAGPSGEGWIVGDLHLENLGAYRPESLSVEEGAPRAAFDLNDFDDAVIGPWRLDVLRFGASLLLGLRGQAVPGADAVAMLQSFIDSYVDGAFGGVRPPQQSRAVARLIKTVETRTRQELLDRRSTLVNGERRFIRGERYRDLPSHLDRDARAAFARYVEKLPAEERIHPEAFDVIDAAFRVAGTGSLGALRVAILARGKGARNGGWVFDMKEQGTPSASAILAAAPMDPAIRVVTAARACLERAPRMIGTTELDGLKMFVRRLAPQEDRIEFDRVPPEERLDLVRHIGGLVGSAHRRGAVSSPAKAWTPQERERLLENAISLAGLHEAAYLAYCRLTRT